MPITLESQHTINNVIVRKLGSFDSTTVFTDTLDPEYGEEEVTLYFVRNHIVRGKVVITAECAQNCGYIDSVKLGEVK